MITIPLLPSAIVCILIGLGLGKVFCDLDSTFDTHPKFSIKLAVLLAGASFVLIGLYLLLILIGTYLNFAGTIITFA